MDFDRTKKVTGQIGMAPMIDVVFLLLIFFLLTSQFVVQRAVELRLPTSRTTAPVSSGFIVVTLALDGTIRVDERQVAVPELRKVLTGLFATDPARAVRIESDATVSVQALVDVLDAVREAGGKRVELAAKPSLSTP